MKIHIDVPPDNKKNILTLLEEQGYSLPCNCHGAHLCNSKNYTFDCAAVPHAPLEVELPAGNHTIRSIALEELTPQPGSADTLLVDLGTTTIALCLIQKKGGRLRQSTTFANPQARFGADVIARIEAATSSAGSELQRCITDELKKEVAHLCQRNRQTVSDLRHCYIGGNTTMIHLLMGFDCASLGRSPFTIQKPSPEPFAYNSCQIHIAPWISAFVGGDITAGLSACGMDASQPATLFVDLGTNGEMVLAHNGVFYATATSAGPALEGGGLSCGCPGIPGAICHVHLRRLSPILDTIDNKLPIGLCGSGAISLCAELVRQNYITAESILTDQFPADGILLSYDSQGRALRFTADDLRNVQLASAAIAAGIDTLLQEAKLTFDKINQLYLGGGFGYYISLKDCDTLGLFSGIPASHITVLGNTCLRGLYQWAFAGQTVCAPDTCHTVNLADHPYFKKQFINHMCFPSISPKNNK